VPTPETQALIERTRQLYLGLVLVLVAGLAGLSSGALTGMAALVLGVAVILGDGPGKRSA
jgi:hypothetical protein